jgi:flagellar protein FliJ
MKKFRFQLDTLLRVTRMKKDEAEVRFADVSRLLEQQRQQLSLLLEEMQRGQRDYENLTKAAHLTVGTLMTYNSFFGWKREQIEMQQAAILQSRANRQKCLQELLKLMNKLKSIEQLREKRLQQYKDAVLLEEQKMLDEIGLQLYMRSPQQEAQT